MQSDERLSEQLQLLIRVTRCIAGISNDIDRAQSVSPCPRSIASDRANATRTTTARRSLPRRSLTIMSLLWIDGESSLLIELISVTRSCKFRSQTNEAHNAMRHHDWIGAWATGGENSIRRVFSAMFGFPGYKETVCGLTNTQRLVDGDRHYFLHCSLASRKARPDHSPIAGFELCNRKWTVVYPVATSDADTRPLSRMEMFEFTIPTREARSLIQDALRRRKPSAENH